MQNCILGLLKDSTVIFACNSAHFFDQADHITVMDDGQIVARGTYEELMNDKDFDFAALVNTNDASDDDDDNEGKSDDENSPEGGPTIAKSLSEAIMRKGSMDSLQCK